MSTPVRFVVVGAFGFIVQLAVLLVLTERVYWPWLPATAVAVECAIVHNFLWHARWTWAGRSRGRSSILTTFLKFNAGSAATSFIGNVAVMAVLVGWARLPAVASSAIAVAATSVANFGLADRWVFRAGSPTGRAARSRVPACSSAARVRCITTLALLAIALAWVPATASSPSVATLDAWNAYVAHTERRLDQTRVVRPPLQEAIVATGDTTDVGSGTVADWRGSVFVKSVTLNQLLDRLQTPGTPPPQDDILAASVLGREVDCLRVYMRLERRAIVTVTYDTEHTIVFHRWSSAQATARSVATRIEEVGGTDRGFLWKLNSYWRYDAMDGGVLVGLQTLTLSRDVPMLVKPIAGRIVPRIAHDSMMRTLSALKQYVEQPR